MNNVSKPVILRERGSEFSANTSIGDMRISASGKHDREIEISVMRGSAGCRLVSLSIEEVRQLQLLLKSIVTHYKKRKSFEHDIDALIKDR